MGDKYMKYKYSIIIGFTSMLAGFIPLSIKNNNSDITYTIYAQSIVKANKIKEELIVFYKQYCYSFSFDSIDNKLVNNLNDFPYKTEYIDHNISIYDESSQIKMTGYLFQATPSSINFKYYFSKTTVSIPDAISISVATVSLSDQIWYAMPL